MTEHKSILSVIEIKSDFLGGACFCFSHVYSARSMEGGIWERGGLEKEQTRVLDGPLRGSARVGQVEFK